jgi:glycyl-tRNA synthetase
VEPRDTSSFPKTTDKNLSDLSQLVSLSKRRGYVFPSSEIYGGINACWDYGPLGAELKRNLKDRWWRFMTSRKDVVGLDAAILMHPKVWEASGHLEGFSDPLVDCTKCKMRFRADQIDSSHMENHCPEKKKCKGEHLTEPRQFNLMFQTHMGPVQDEGSVVYLRPETAQGIYVNFEQVQQSCRMKVPFGIAQIGKAFRNEITPGHFIFRTREFEQMEMQFFVKPGEDESWFEKWKELRYQWHLDNGLRREKLRFHEHAGDELAHYAKAAFDIEYEFPMGFSELEGVHNRTDFDLRRHQEFSGKKLQYFDDQSKEKYLPYVVETSVGCDRALLAILCDAYRVEYDENGNDIRTVLRLHPSLAPIKVATLPLSKKPELQALSEKVFQDLQKEGTSEYDEAGSIGKRYRRQDEIGTPFCVTIDFDSLDDHAVTVRHRDDMRQDRIPLDGLKDYLRDRFKEIE